MYTLFMDAWLSGASYRANTFLWGSFEGTSEAKSVSIFGDRGPFCGAETLTLQKTGHSGTEPVLLLLFSVVTNMTQATQGLASSQVTEMLVYLHI